MTAQWVSSFRTAYERLQARRPLRGSGQKYREEPLVAPAQDRQPQTAVTLRRLHWLYSIPVSLVVVLAAALLAVRLAPGAVPSLRTVPDDLLPGRRLPMPSTCTHPDPEHPAFYEVNCAAFRGYFVYDIRDRVISYTSYPLDNVTLGDLILAWGAPDSFLDQFPLRVFWGVKSALISPPLRVTSRVVLVSHFRDAASLPAGRCAWRGLVSTESTNCPDQAVSMPIPSAAQR